MNYSNAFLYIQRNLLGFDTTHTNSIQSEPESEVFFRFQDDLRFEIPQFTNRLVFAFRRISCGFPPFLCVLADTWHGEITDNNLSYHSVECD